MANSSKHAGTQGARTPRKGPSLTVKLSAIVAVSIIFVSASLYCTDVSLLLAMRDFSLKQGIAEGTLSGNTKGGLYESFMADALLKSGYELHFYRSESTKRELDFIIQKEGCLIPVEVKEGRNTANSLKVIMRGANGSELAYKVADANVEVDEDAVVTDPHFMAMYM